MVFDDMYGGEKCKFYKLTKEDAKTLQIEKEKESLYDPIIAYSFNQRENGVIMLAFFIVADGGRSTRIATYKNKKLVSIGKEVFAKNFGDIGTVVNAQTQTLNDSTFYTVYKLDHYGDLFHEHKETATIINKNGEIKQSTVITSKKDY